MDLQIQANIKEVAESTDKDTLVVVLGSPDVESAEIAAETVVSGDPTFAGPLAGTQLGLLVYHVMEEEVRNLIPPEVWETQIGVMADVLDAQSLELAMSAIRTGGVTGADYF